jgi:hypothetical protein|tara:strand:- start:117 stop:767 length:651 start_codon:yes stop_codon:yes gene_type:complete
MALNINGTTGISGVDGSVSAPALTGTDSNTGITFPSADTIKFATGGVERMSITNSGVSGITAGITMADQWRITSTFQVSSNSYITTNWERNDTAGYAKIGTGMSESSGVFSFPETGIYLVGINLTGNSDGGAFNYVACSIYTTLNNSSYTQSASTYESVDDTNRHWAMATEFLLDVTDISNCKVKFFMSSSNTRPYVYGDSSLNTTFAHFTRLGDT